MSQSTDKLGSPEEIILAAMEARKQPRTDHLAEIVDNATKLRDKINTPAIGGFRRITNVMEEHCKLELKLVEIRQRIRAAENGEPPPQTNGD